jgi:hypothetical protein
MPSGAAPGGGALFGTVGKNPAATIGEGVEVTEVSVDREESAHAAKERAAATVSVSTLTTVVEVSGRRRIGCRSRFGFDLRLAMTPFLVAAGLQIVRPSSWYSGCVVS